MNKHILAQAFIFLILAASAPGQSTTRVSVNAAGIPGHGDSLAPAISADGRYVVFESDADNLDALDQNLFRDIFVHDRASGATELVSTYTQGLPTAAIRSTISGNGRVVSYQANILVMPGQPVNNLFTYNLDTGVVSGVASAANSSSDFNATLSHDGRFVAYSRMQLGVEQVFLSDMMSLGITTVSVSFSPGVVGNGNSSFPSVSADGSRVAFHSFATNLVPNDTNNAVDVFVRDLLAGTTQRVSVTSAGAQTGGGSEPVLSADGRYVAFVSVAGDIVPGDTNGLWDVFLHDLQTGVTQRVSISSTGMQVNGSFRGVSISSVGPRVVFTSTASELVPGDTNGLDDVFMRDVAAGTTTRISVNSAGSQALGQSLSGRRAAISDNGLCAVFSSSATNLVIADINGTRDIFVRDLGSACPPIEAYCTAKVNSSFCTPVIGASGEPSLGGADSFFIVAEQMLGQEQGILAWSLAPTAQPFFGGTLCLQPPLVRTPMQIANGPVAAVACMGTYSFHWSQAYMTGLQLVAGTTVYAQYWARDPGSSAQGVSLTDALRFTICP